VSEFDGLPTLRSPVAIAAFEGWNDAADASTAAVEHLEQVWSAKTVAELDPEEFYDFQVNRPTVRLQAGLTRRLDWPTNEFFVAGPGGRDAVLLIGVEPNVRWRTYGETVLQVASEVEASLLVTLGAFLADVPHTAAAPVAASSTDPEWLRRPEIEAARYEGPTGIVGVLHDAASRVGLPSLSLWGAAPHYLPSTANPKVALALLEAVRDVLSLQIDTGDLERVAVGWQRRVDEEIGEDAELSDYVRRLEEASGGSQYRGPVPSGEDLAAELERYLRDRRPDE
jgi:proteasome assembly chaperone (PAC2) family protein